MTLANSTPLNDEELAALRAIIEADKRRIWLMSGVRSAASWIVIVLSGVAVGWESIKAIARSAGGGGD